MKIKTFNQLRFADTGMIILQADSSLHKFLKNICAEEPSMKKLTIVENSTYAVDIELYRKVMIAQMNALEHIPSTKNSAIIPKEPEQLPMSEIIEKIRNSKRSWLGFSNTTNSTYLHGTVGGKFYEIRESDHNKDGSPGYSLSVVEVEKAKKFWLTNNTPKGKVTYSTEFKTTVVDEEGNKSNYTTAFLRELMEKESDNKK